MQGTYLRVLRISTDREKEGGRIERKKLGCSVVSRSYSPAEG
jgi:hypothetical protein